MWIACVTVGLLLVSGNCVLLRDPKIFPCDDYDLSDPVRRVITEPASLESAADYEYLAQQVVQQLNARSNSISKSMLLSLKSFNKTEDGAVRLNIHQMESLCRNDGKLVTSLMRCPLKENGMIQNCDVIVRILPIGSHQRFRVAKFACRRIHVDAMSGLRNEDSFTLSDSLQMPALAGFQAPTPDNFRCFILRHGKIYESGEEREVRFEQFKANMKLAYFLQATEQGTGVYGPTKFSDLNAIEFKKTSTGLLPDKARAQPLQRATLPQVQAEDLPEAFDWRNKSAVTPVKDQGQCGSCWAFSTTGNIEGQWAIKRGKLVSLSEQELVDCDKVDEGCGGGLPSNAYKEIIRLGGLDAELDYPYDGKNDQCSFKKPDAAVFINDSVAISTNETEMAAWLSVNGPISIGINANAMMLYMSGVSHPWKVVCNPKNLDHGVLIVGYGVDDKKKPYWIVKNSWGSHWGVKGYYLVFRGDGTCGLNMMCTSAIVN